MTDVIAAYGAAWLAALAALGLYGGFAWVVVQLGRLAADHAVRRYRIRRELRHLEQYANHPGARRLIDAINEAREEGQQS